MKQKIFYKMVRKFAEEQSQQGTNNLKAIDNKINEIETYLVKLKKKTRKYYQI